LDKPTDLISLLDSNIENPAADYVISYYDEDFKVFAQLDSIEFLPAKCKILIEKQGHVQRGISIDEFVVLKPNSKEETLLKFEREQFRIASYQDKLSEIINKLQKDSEVVRKQMLEVPEEYIDPITQEIMCDPVFTSDGHTYERQSIKLWLKKHDTSPLTNMSLESKKLVPNLLLKKQIAEFREKAELLDREANDKEISGNAFTSISAP
jgi:hypothetical protein